MKKLTFLATILLFSNILFAQKTELRIYLHGNALHFVGNNAEESTIFLPSDYGGSGYTNNPYGKKSDLGFGVSINVKQITKSNFIYGADVGYENLKSKIIVTKIVFLGGNSDASGKTNLVFNNLNIFGFFGYRIPAGKINVDLSAGTDFGFILSSKEKAGVTDSKGVNYSNSVDRKTISMDFRPRLQLEINYKKYGAFLGYSFGTVNYMQNYDGGNPDVKSQIFRFGLSYQFN